MLQRCLIQQAVAKGRAGERRVGKSGRMKQTEERGQRHGGVQDAIRQRDRKVLKVCDKENVRKC